MSQLHVELFGPFSRIKYSKSLIPGALFHSRMLISIFHFYFHLNIVRYKHVQ